MNDKPFNTLINSFFKVCVYMLLREQKLSINITEYKNRNLKYIYYSKKEALNIEGFPKEKTPCLVILPPPLLRKKYPFNGLKPTVYSIKDPTHFIIEECESNLKEQQASKSSGNTPINKKIKDLNLHHESEASLLLRALGFEDQHI